MWTICRQNVVSLSEFCDKMSQFQNCKLKNKKYKMLIVDIECQIFSYNVRRYDKTYN